MANTPQELSAIHVLIADDEPNQLELVSFNLTQAGYTVTKASDGQQALDLAEELVPDLMILDWMMPKLSGIDVCQAIRQKPELKHLPVVMLSARGEEGDKILGLDIGADDYITKPFSPRELLSRVQAVLRRSRPALVTEMLEFADIKLYPAKKLVERDGEEIHLSQKEFKILSILMERPEQVFSRAQLLDHAWGHGVYVEDRTIDVHLSRLRKSMNFRGDDLPERPNLIKTVHGSGYALVDKPSTK